MLPFRAYIQVTGYNLEQAVGLYLIQNGDDGAVARRANAGSGHQPSSQARCIWQVLRLYMYRSRQASVLDYSKTVC